MKRRDLLNLIEQGEGMNVEFKQRFSDYLKIAKEIIAFANSGGGVIIFGVNDDKSVCGVQSEKSEADLINETAANYCQPPVIIKIEYFEIDNKELVVVSVPESDNKPHRIQDYKKDLDLNNAHVYIRVNDKSVLASKSMIKILQVRSANKSIVNYEVGKNEKIAFEYLDKYETITVKELGRIANISDRRASRTLIKLVRVNLLNIHTKDNGEEYFTYAG